MVDVTLTSVVGGGSGIRLIPDLTFPSSLASPISGTDSVTAVNTTAALTEMLGLSGKYAIEYLELNSMALESAQIKLTIDSEIIWNDTFVLTAANLILCGAQDAGFTAAIANAPFLCDTDFSLEVQMSADTSIGLSFLARPIS